MISLGEYEEVSFMVFPTIPEALSTPDVFGLDPL
jgi:hypothetical protein